MLYIVGLNEIQEWDVNFTPKSPSAYYLETIKKLKAYFDLSLSEAAKSLLISHSQASAWERDMRYISKLLISIKERA